MIWVSILPKKCLVIARLMFFTTSYDVEYRESSYQSSSLIDWHTRISMTTSFQVICRHPISQFRWSSSSWRILPTAGVPSLGRPSGTHKLGGGRKQGCKALLREDGGWWHMKIEGPCFWMCNVYIYTFYLITYVEDTCRHLQKCCHVGLK